MREQDLQIEDERTPRERMACGDKKIKEEQEGGPRRKAAYSLNAKVGEQSEIQSVQIKNEGD